MPELKKNTTMTKYIGTIHGRHCIFSKLKQYLSFMWNKAETGLRCAVIVNIGHLADIPMYNYKYNGVEIISLFFLCISIPIIESIETYDILYYILR